MVVHTPEYRIHTYTAAEAGLLVNSYLVETADGVVLVDANLLQSDVHAIARIADAKREQWQPVYGAEWPDKYRVPDRRLSDGDIVELGGLRFALHAVGAAESHADSYITLGDVRMLADQRRYLLMYRETVRRLAAAASSLTDPQREELTAVMTRFLSGAPLSWMISLGADAVAAELADATAAGVPA